VSRVLLSGGAGAIGAAVARRLLADPAYEVRIADRRPAPQWMREGCEIDDGDLRSHARAQAATKGCSHVVHLAAFAQSAAGDPTPQSLIEYEAALHNAVIRAAAERRIERFVYVSSPLVFEHAELFPTSEEQLDRCPAPSSARGFSALSGERHCRAAHEEHGLPFAICRPFGAYASLATGNGNGNANGESGEQNEGDRELDPRLDRTVMGALAQARAARQPLEIRGSAERTLTPTHVEDIAAGILAALSDPAALNEDFDLAAEREMSVADIARSAWAACGQPPEELELKELPPVEIEPQRSWPSAEKARKRLRWRAQIDVEHGITGAV
jgi:UDP-glucose 4-epimerase